MIFNEYSVPIKFLTYLYCFDFIFLTALHTHSAKKKEKTRKKPQTLSFITWGCSWNTLKELQYKSSGKQ